MKLKESIVISKINDEFVLVDADASKNRFNGLVKLNEVAKDVVETMNGKDVTYDEIVQFMLDKYDVDENTLRADIDKVITKLQEIAVIS